MKKIFCILCALLLLTACGKSEIVANKKLVCNFRSSVDNQTLVSKVIIKYDSESGKVIKGTFLTEYDNLAQNETNNSIKLKYGDRKYIIDQIEGVTTLSNGENDGYIFKETWDYSVVDVSKAVNMDEQQENFIENGEYSVKKIKEYYEKRGYTCEEKDIKN